MHTMVAEMQESQGNRFVLRYHYGEVECRKEWQKLGCEPSFIETMSLGEKKTISLRGFNISQLHI